ncbi:MAG: glycosyltransferase, partial [Caldilineaceae bacterium]|nr:glycosyltransferase [Caldilineaceae bacterium]
MKPIHVLQLLSGLAVEGPLGGVARFGIELSHHLNPDLVRVTLCGLWDYHTGYEARWQQELTAQGIPTVIAAPWNETSPYRSCVTALTGARSQLNGPFDLIHSHGEFADLAAIALRRRYGAQALVRTVHNEREWSKRPLFGAFFTNLLYPFAFRRELGVAQTVVDNLNRRPLARLTNHHAQVAYNALNVQRFAAQPANVERSAINIPRDAYVVGSVGRLRPQKGYHIWLAAAAQARAAVPNVHFVLIGEGELRPQLEAQARELGIDDVVTFLGPRHDVEALYPLMDLFVSSSLWEGLPTVILEAMAARRPVVGTAVAGTRELVVDGQTGRLVPPDDPQALAMAIVESYRNPVAAAQMAAQAQT